MTKRNLKEVTVAIKSPFMTGLKVALGAGVAMTLLGALAASVPVLLTIAVGLMSN